MVKYVICLYGFYLLRFSDHHAVSLSLCTWYDVSPVNGNVFFAGGGGGGSGGGAGPSISQVNCDGNPVVSVAGNIYPDNSGDAYVI